MKKLIFAVLIPLLLIQCNNEPEPSLADFCGETAITSTHYPGYEYYLSFKSKKTAGLVTLSVTREEYNVYKDGARPIDCPNDTLGDK